MRGAPRSARPALTAGDTEAEPQRPELTPALNGPVHTLVWISTEQLSRPDEAGRPGAKPQRRTSGLQTTPAARVPDGRSLRERKPMTPRKSPRKPHLTTLAAFGI